MFGETCDEGAFTDLKQNPDPDLKYFSRNILRDVFPSFPVNFLCSPVPQGLNLGDVFVMRNIGNLCVNTDHSMLAALQYSVEVLGVRMAMSVKVSRNPQLVGGTDGPHVLVGQRCCRACRSRGSSVSMDASNDRVRVCFVVQTLPRCKGDIAVRWRRVLPTISVWDQEKRKVLRTENQKVPIIE